MPFFLLPPVRSHYSLLGDFLGLKDFILPFWFNGAIIIFDLMGDSRHHPLTELLRILGPAYHQNRKEIAVSPYEIAVFRLIAVARFRKLVIISGQFKALFTGKFEEYLVILPIFRLH
jgi:hypothetical protein